NAVSGSRTGNGQLDHVANQVKVRRFVLRTVSPFVVTPRAKNRLFMMLPNYAIKLKRLPFFNGSLLFSRLARLEGFRYAVWPKVQSDRFPDGADLHHR